VPSDEPVSATGVWVVEDPVTPAVEELETLELLLGASVSVSWAPPRAGVHPDAMTREKRAMLGADTPALYRAMRLRPRPKRCRAPSARGPWRRSPSYA